jgi:molecular chaperone GrpE
MGEAKEGKKERSKKNIKLKNELKAKTKEAEEYLTNLKYLKADFENYKKRMEREKEDLCRFATESLILEILEVVDNLERAIEAGKAGEGDKKNLLEGVEMTYKQLMKIFEKQGVECIRAEGSIFDPHMHECVLTENTDKFEEDTVIQELLKGYTMNSRVIRHSRVKIAKNS